MLGVKNPEPSPRVHTILARPLVGLRLKIPNSGLCGAIVEEGNYDLFNLHAFSYKATESK